MVTDADVDALYAEPPERFTKARDALAKKAKEAGRADLAIELRGLRKPTAAVWLVNLLARKHPREVRALIEAADDVRSAQEKALRERAPASLRPAMEAWRGAVKNLVRRGRELLASEGRKGIDEGRVGETLSGASADPAHAKHLERGTLTEEVAPPGLESLLGVSSAAPRARPPKARAERATEPKPNARALRAGEREEEARRKKRATEIAKLERALADAAKTAKRSAREAEVADRAASAAVKKRDETRSAAVAAAERARELEAQLEGLKREGRN
jgi:hypothetical protein